MKIYFAGSIRAGRQDIGWYVNLVKILRRFGVVLTEYVGDATLPPLGERGYTDRQIYDKDMAWIREADVLVAEVTGPSLGVGYEIAMAEQANKPILCLHRPQPDRRLSGIIGGDPNIVLKEYQTMEEAEEIVKEFMGVRV